MPHKLHGQTVLVTGGAGFIGSELTRQLLAMGARVRVVDNLVNGKRENLAELTNAPLELHVADIRDEAALAPLLKGVCHVYHLATLGVRHSIHSPQENHEVNATATLRLLALAKAAGVERFVYVSSSEVYGTARTVPMTEEHPTYPMTVYGASKLAGECYTRAYYQTYGYPTVVVRPFNAYGPRSHHEGDSGEVIPKFLLRCMAGKPLVIFGDGQQTRDFTYVADTAHGILLAGLHDDALGQTINIGNGREISIAQLADLIRASVGRADVPIEYSAPRPGDVLRLYADTAKAQSLLDYAPRITLREGIARLKAWYERQPHSVEDLLQSEIVRNWEAPAHS